MVVPILCYGAELWGYEYCHSIEHIHVKFCKYLLGVSNSTPTAAVLGELGRTPISMTYNVKCIKYWLKLLEMDDNRLPRLCYKLLHEYDSSGRRTWATEVKNLLFEMGFGHAWTNQGVGDQCLFINCFRDRLRDMAQQEWRNTVNSTPKLRTYTKFKSELSFEKYLTLNTAQYSLQLYTKFRCGVLQLEIERGRHQNIETQDRICKLCKLEVEDEYHFLMSCKELDDIRNKYLNNLVKPINTYNFSALLSSQKEETLYRLINYIRNAWRTRLIKIDAMH